MASTYPTGGVRAGKRTGVRTGTRSPAGGAHGPYILKGRPRMTPPANSNASKAFQAMQKAAKLARKLNALLALKSLLEAWQLAGSNLAAPGGPVPNGYTLIWDDGAHPGVGGGHAIGQEHFGTPVRVLTGASAPWTAPNPAHVGQSTTAPGTLPNQWPTESNRWMSQEPYDYFAEGVPAAPYAYWRYRLYERTDDSMGLQPLSVPGRYGFVELPLPFYYPELWPDGLPIQQPVPNPRPLPGWAPRPHYSPLGDPIRGPSPQPNPRPLPRPDAKPNPDPEPDNRPLARGRLGAVVRGAPRGSVSFGPHMRHAPPHKRKPPGKHTKEAKLIGSIDGKSPLGLVLNAGTELGDLVDALWKSLKSGQTKKPGERTSLIQKGKDIYDNFDRVDWTQFWHNWADSQSGDRLGGQIGKHTRNANRASGHRGLTGGPAL